MNPDPPPAPVVCNDALIDHEHRDRDLWSVADELDVRVFVRLASALPDLLERLRVMEERDQQLSGLVMVVLETSDRLDAATLGQDAAVAGVGAFMRGAVRHLVGDEFWDDCDATHWARKAADG